MESTGTDLNIFNDKQSPSAMKKLALRDVQNNNRSVSLNHSTKSSSPGLPTGDGKKVSGIKRPKPTSSSNHPCYLLLTENELNGQILNDGSKVDMEISKKRSKGHSNMSCAPVVASLPTASMVISSPGIPSIPIFLEKPDTGIAALDSNHLKVTNCSEVPDIVAYDSKYDLRRKERLLQLHNLLKFCDESDQRDYVHVLRCLSPPELSRYAVELEKRSIHLSFEEGKEIQRMKALNILGNFQ